MSSSLWDFSVKSSTSDWYSPVVHLWHWYAGQTFIFQHGGSVIRPAAKAGGSVEDGELKPASGAAGQLQPLDQTGDGGLQHEGRSVLSELQLYAETAESVLFDTKFTESPADLKD